jgi:hypothetical protein
MINNNKFGDESLIKKFLNEPEFKEGMTRYETAQYVIQIEEFKKRLTIFGIWFKSLKKK